MRICLICQTTITIPKTGMLRGTFELVCKKYDTDFPPKSELRPTRKHRYGWSHSITQEDAGVNIAASQSVAKLFFSVGKRKPSCPYELWGVLLTLKAAHLNNWIRGLTFLR